MDAFTLGLSRGKLDKLGYILKFGRNLDIDTAAEEDITDIGGTWMAPT